MISTQVGFDITPDQMANDLALMKAALPSDKTQYVLTSPDGLTTDSTLANPYPGKTVLNGGDALAATENELPALDGRAVDGSTMKLTVPAEAVAFVVMEGIKDGISGC